jgi:7-carboxy-7-deazaguanine synthase
MNTQEISKADMDPIGTLDVHSIFYTIQGEGPFSGKPAIFIRLWGCNLQCPGCDTDYTSKKSAISVALLLAKLVELKNFEQPDAPLPMVVITGGEPFRQNIVPLSIALVLARYVVQIETNGTLPVPALMPHEVSIVCSPKTGKIHPSVEHRATAFKYVVKAGLVVPRDGFPIRALDHTCTPSVAKPPAGFKGSVFIQPMDEKLPIANRKNMQAAVQSCLTHGHTLQIQIHKVVGVE